MMQLKELFNVNHFIVSQANPHIAPFLRFKDFVRAYGGDFAAKVSFQLEADHAFKSQYDVIALPYQYSALMTAMHVFSWPTWRRWR